MCRGFGVAPAPMMQKRAPIFTASPLRAAGLVTRTGSMDEAAPRIARLIQSTAREVFAGSLILESV